MSICKKCGKEYLTKVCIKCRDKEYREKLNNSVNGNFKNKRKNIDNAGNGKSEHKNKMIKVGIIFISIISITIISIMFLKIIDQREKELRQDKRIEQLENNKRNIERYNRQLVHNNSILTKNINTLKRNKRRYSNNQHTTSKRKTYPKKNTKPKQQKKKTIIYEQPKRIYETQKTRTYEQPRRVHNTPTKYYQKFSRYIKLVSDSSIKIRSDNRLKSNAPIFGKFIPEKYSTHPNTNQISDINCNLKENYYNVVDECNMKISNEYDTVYLGEMDSHHIKDFDRNTHMIECRYSQEHGLMHDCKIKRYDMYL